MIAHRPLVCPSYGQRGVWEAQGTGIVLHFDLLLHHGLMRQVRCLNFSFPFMILVLARDLCSHLPLEVVSHPIREILGFRYHLENAGTFPGLCLSGGIGKNYFFKRRMNNYIYISGYSSFFCVFLFFVRVAGFVAMCTLGFCNLNV